MWGLKLEKITVTDFDLSPEIVKARGEVQEMKRAVEAAALEKEARAHQTIGALIQMLADARGKTFKEIQEEVDKSHKLKKEVLRFSEELITRKMSVDGKCLTDVRVSGTESDTLKSLLTLIAAFKQLPEKTTGKPQKKDKPGRQEQSERQSPDDD